jgi:hypothetical protein
MKRLDEDFLTELEGKIDETFTEKQPDEGEIAEDQRDTGADQKVITDPNLPPVTHDAVVVQNNAESVTYDLTAEEVMQEKERHDPSNPPQAEGAPFASRRYHPMELSTNTIVTKDNVEFAVRKFVKDIKEGLRFSKAISVRFEIKTVDE